ncbi:hypothetical protein EC973_009029 [Apophysomyces ossiformis]|uniref:Alpha/beta hydrolase fold-3 domain-containing protein n=1 Tax=Apophysomyces ossiformis TaxID=679940 RepID=A0A8H7ENQ0_9FUNG|nr:hypothetical protein EC973_009029 [Apophysomyces ossiformis]
MPDYILEPMFKQFLTGLDPNLDPTALPLEESRSLFDDVPPGAVLRDASVKERTIDTDYGEIVLTVTRPLGTENETLPAIVYFHGGGWAQGIKYSHALIQRELAIEGRVAVVFVNYDRSPEVKFPVAIEQCYASVAWLANKENAASLSVDANKIAVAGDSAGVLAKKRKLSAIKFQILYYPVTNDDFETPSYCDLAKGYFLTKDWMKLFWNLYIPVEERSSILACPLKATLEDLKDLPPAYVVAVEADVLRDEGEAYAARLMEAGVDVVAVRTFGALHGFFNMPKLTSIGEAVVQQSVHLLHKAWKK